jgi:hypothetical protein
MLSAASIRMYQMQVVFRSVALYASALAFSNVAGGHICAVRRHATDREDMARPIVSPVALSDEHPLRGEWPLILPAIGSYGHPALSRVDFSQTRQSADAKGGQDYGTIPECRSGQKQDSLPGLCLAPSQLRGCRIGADRKIPEPESPEVQPQPFLLFPAVPAGRAALRIGLT